MLAKQDKKSGSHSTRWRNALKTFSAIVEDHWNRNCFQPGDDERYVSITRSRLAKQAVLAPVSERTNDETFPRFSILPLSIAFFV